MSRLSLHPSRRAARWHRDSVWFVRKVLRRMIATSTQWWERGDG